MVGAVVGLFTVVVGYFTRRVIASIDKNSDGLGKHSELLSLVSSGLENLREALKFTTLQTNSEISVIKERIKTTEEEIHTLRDVRHEHGNALTSVQLKQALLEKEFNSRMSLYEGA